MMKKIKDSIILEGEFKEGTTLNSIDPRQLGEIQEICIESHNGKFYSLFIHSSKYPSGVSFSYCDTCHKLRQNNTLTWEREKGDSVQCKECFWKQIKIREKRDSK